MRYVLSQLAHGLAALPHHEQIVDLVNITHQKCEFRNAAPGDADAAVPLIYSAGPAAIDYGFSCHGHAGEDFLRFAFIDGKGFLGYQNHTVATMDGQVVGIVACYNLPRYLRLTCEHLVQLWHYYSLPKLPDLLVRANHLKSTMPAPGIDTHYVANFGVPANHQGMGVGTALLNHQRHAGLAMKRARFALDVSIENPRAQAMYERYGFEVGCENQFSGPMGAVPNTRRLTVDLDRCGRR